MHITMKDIFKKNGGTLECESSGLNGINTDSKNIYDQMICVNTTLTIHVTLQEPQSHSPGEFE